MSLEKINSSWVMKWWVANSIINLEPQVLPRDSHILNFLRLEKMIMLDPPRSQAKNSSLIYIVSDSFTYKVSRNQVEFYFGSVSFE